MTMLKQNFLTIEFVSHLISVKTVNINREVVSQLRAT